MKLRLTLLEPALLSSMPLTPAVMVLWLIELELAPETISAPSPLVAHMELPLTELAEESLRYRPLAPAMALRLIELALELSR